MSHYAGHDNALPPDAAISVREPLNSDEIFVPIQKSVCKELIVSWRFCVEYGIYSLYVFCFLCYGWITVADASYRSGSLLSVGPEKWTWIVNLPFRTLGYDTADIQWRYFDRSMWDLLLFLFFVVLVSRCVRFIFASRQKSGARCANALHLYHATIGLLYIAFLHGSIFVIPVMITVCNFLFVKLCVKLHLRSTYYMLLVWATQLSLLFTVVYADGFEHSVTLRPIASLWRRRIRWHTMFNLYTLRMIAFSMDFFWAARDGAAQQERALRRHDTACVECAQLRETGARCYKFRTEFPLPLVEYNLVSYVAYMFYAPLYIAGPMSSFNAFVSHIQVPTRAVSWGQKILYGACIWVIYVTIVVMLHYLYMNALREAPSVFFSFNFAEKAFVFYYSLAFLWLKFALIWRFARFFALLDGIDVPEDMRRCFSNTVSVRDFWRDWHASFNLWIVRYMYIPMGGSTNKHLKIIPIFFFIAIWHDVSLNLIKWAMCVVVIFMLEIFVAFLWNSRRCSFLRCSRYERFFRTFGAVFTVLGLIVANVIGFSYHNSSSNVQFDKTNGVHSDDGATSIFSTSWFGFVFLAFIFIYSTSSLSILCRDVESARDMALRKRLNLVC